MKLKQYIWIAALSTLSWAQVTCGATEDLAAALRQGRTDVVEASLSKVQRDFESGQATEIELRNAFRPLYTLDAVAAINLRNWATAAPKSYSAHLALGIYLKRLGLTARGEKYIAHTSPVDLAAMAQYFDDANNFLGKSLTLTPKPYLSLFHLLDIAGHVGERETAKQWLGLANAIAPQNSLVRGRYLGFLLPRWGGSYEEVDAFIKESAAAGVAATTLWQLEAIKLDDMGRQLAERGEAAAARAHFEKALELGAKVSGPFSSDFIPTSVRVLCADHDAPFCP